jgi:hypothetical protein
MIHTHIYMYVSKYTRMYMHIYRIRLLYQHTHIHTNIHKIHTGLDGAVAGTPLFVQKHDDNIEELKDAVMQDLNEIMGDVSTTGRYTGLCVCARVYVNIRMWCVCTYTCM